MLVCVLTHGWFSPSRQVADRTRPAMQELFPALTLLAKLGQAPYYDDEPGAPS